MVPRHPGIPISCAVEGPTDEAIIQRLIRDAGGIPGQIYGKSGKSHLLRKIDGFNNAANRSPWVVLTDLDHDKECAPPFRQAWLPEPAPHMCFRVVVREIEAWLLADRSNLGSFLKVRLSLIPKNPDDLDRPKETMVNLARRSRRPAITEDMVPRPRSGQSVGPAYVSRLIEFIQSRWRPDEAERSSDSLRRCRKRISELISEMS